MAQHFDEALLFRRIATLELDCDVGAVDDWQWNGPTDDLAQWCDLIDAPDILRNATSLANRR